MDSLEDFEPLDYYKSQLGPQFLKNATELFDSLVKQSGVDTAANTAAVTRYNAAQKKADAAGKKLASGKAVRGLMIFLTVAAAIAAVVLLILYARGGSTALLIVGIVCVAVAVGCLAGILAGMNKLIAARQKRFDKLTAAAAKVREEAENIIRPLFPLFTWDITRRLVEKTFPDIRIDERLSVEKLDLFTRKYGYNGGENDTESSVVFLLSGEVEGNPFLFERRIRCNIVSRRYTGSIVIHWTTYTTDSKGNSHAVHHSQTLTASVLKPAPEYGLTTRMYYGNEAAPDLKFTRTPKYSHTHDEQELEKVVKRGGKKLAAKTRRAAANGGGFTEIANTEFEVLFGATDRTDEVEFRLMFTPLAQQNMVELLTSSDGYGDDFSFVKNGMLNCISSDHATYWQPWPDPSRYVSYDLAASRAAFLAYNTEYFKSVYFDLAPVLSIPLYRMQKPHEFIYKDVYPSNYAQPQSEVLANCLGENQFSHPDSRTRSVLKVRFSNKDGASDKVTVTAYGYATENRVDYIDVFGGDGRMHVVPVHWIEYIPVDRTSVMEVKAVGGTRESFEKMRAEEKLAAFVRRYSPQGVSAYCDGLMAMPLGCGYGKADDAALGEIFNLNSPAGAAAVLAGVAAAEAAADAVDAAERAEKDGNENKNTSVQSAEEHKNNNQEE